MQKKKRQKLNDIAIHGENKAQDLISKLPDELLHSIISFLPTKEAVATSIYSKRWRFLWKSVSRISLDLHQINNNHHARSFAIVDKVLSSLSSNVKFFRLHHSLQTWGCSDYMIRWIEFLKNEKRLEGISLSGDRTITNFYGWFLVSNLGEHDVQKSVIPKENIFHGGFLQFVELNKYVLTDGLPFKGCVNVKTLKLGDCLLVKNTLVEILENCKELEKLNLHRCYYKSIDVSISHQKLKLLEIFHMNERKFYLNSESLEKLVLENCAFSAIESRILCPNLQVLQTNVAWLPGLKGLLMQLQQRKQGVKTISPPDNFTIKRAQKLRRINLG